MRYLGSTSRSLELHLNGFRDFGQRALACLGVLEALGVGAYIYIHIHPSIHPSIHACIIYLHMYININIYICVCILYIYAYIYVCMYVHCSE